MLTSDVCQQNGYKQNLKIVQGEHCVLSNPRLTCFFIFSSLIFLYLLMIKKKLSMCSRLDDFEKRSILKIVEIFAFNKHYFFYTISKVLSCKILPCSIFSQHQVMDVVLRKLMRSFTFEMIRDFKKAGSISSNCKTTELKVTNNS